MENVVLQTVRFLHIPVAPGTHFPFSPLSGVLCFLEKNEKLSISLETSVKVWCRLGHVRQTLRTLPEAIV